MSLKPGARLRAVHSMSHRSMSLNVCTMFLFAIAAGANKSLHHPQMTVQAQLDLLMSAADRTALDAAKAGASNFC